LDSTEPSQSFQIGATGDSRSPLTSVFISYAGASKARSTG
jgi:hypothetical protein